MKTHFDVAVVGAGAVGCACALWTQEAGFDVVLIDKSEPGAGASFGNAGIFSTSGCIPVNSPALFRDLPKMTLRTDSPLSINWFYAITHLPWMLRFLRQCTPERVRHISEKLALILGHTEAGMMPLIERAGAQGLLDEVAPLYLYGSEQSFNSGKGGIERRRELGVRLDILDEAEVRELEPHIRAPVFKALRFTDSSFIRNPGALVKRLAEKFSADGGTIIEGSVDACTANENLVAIAIGDEKTIMCEKLILAAGAHSTKIKGTGAEHLPLDTERGYHIAYHGHQDKLSRPVGSADGGFYASPMDTGLRLAGTVEIAGTENPPSPKRLAYLQGWAEKMFGDMGEPDETWLGFRPTMPDSLPVIGPAKNNPNILLAFGHQHLGLTMSGITGRVISDLVQGRAPNFDISSFSPARFE
ncbi:MAG: NAD(P)/FAD-dependent oxidoreductase [Hyphomicrobiales bacterium]